MKRLLALAPLLALIAAAPEASVDQTLELMHQRGKDLKSLAADVKLVNVDIDLGAEDDTRTGKLILLREEDDAKLRVTFTKRQKGERVTEERQDFVIDGRKLITRDWGQKKETVRLIAREGEKIDLFRLGEGPFPLPIGQSPEEVKQEFEVKALSSKDPALVKLELTPKPGSKLARKFKYVIVHVNAEGWPVRVETSDPNETQLIRAELSNIRAGAEVKPDEFALEKIDDTWNRVEDRFQE